MLLVTGGAGFIGSNLVAALNAAGRTDVVVCDVLGNEGKWRNLAKRQLVDIVPPGELTAWLAGRRLDAVFHLGAISATTERDVAAAEIQSSTLGNTAVEECIRGRVLRMTFPQPGGGGFPSCAP